MSDKLESEMRSGCGPGQSVPEPTPNVRPTEAEYIRRVAKGLQDAADAMAHLARYAEIRMIGL